MVLPGRRQLSFVALYFCEGAPIGILWWALPAYWYDAGVSVERLSVIAGVLVVPRSLQWLWASPRSSIGRERPASRLRSIGSQVRL